MNIYIQKKYVTPPFYKDEFMSKQKKMITK